MTIDLSTMAVLVDLTTTAWSGVTRDKGAEDELTDTKNAKRDVARVTKVLLGGLDDHRKAIIAIQARARTLYTNATIPWGSGAGFRNGRSRLCPVSLLENLSRQLAECKQVELPEAVNNFVEAYENGGIREKAIEQLGDLANLADYPSPDRLRAAFDIKWCITPLGTPEKAFGIRNTGIPVDLLFNTMQEGYQRAIDGMSEHMYELVHVRMSKLAGKLRDPEATFRDSLITNVLDLVAQLDEFNLCGDVRISAVMDNLRWIAKQDPQVFRDDLVARATAVEQAEAIMAYIPLVEGE